ncbi:MAG: dTDP-glucose 4,6-dehydratase [Bacillota bacterium]|nr:dTDP-glucose 4,6-dehydratase [Bacillota bacterium]
MNNKKEYKQSTTNYKSPTILVTGGAGFIGSNFIIYLLNKYPGYKVLNLDALKYSGNLDNLKDIEHYQNYSFIKGDICDTKLLDRLFNEHKPDYVVNFAAESHVDRSINDPGIFVRTNVEGTQVLLDACRKHWLRNGSELRVQSSEKTSDFQLSASNKYLQISTDEVYGSLGDKGYFNENSPLAPNSPYSASKASADMFVRAYYKTYGLNINITRCSNNFGLRQYPEKLIPLMITNALQDKELPVYGDGMNIRDWLYVEDHCRAIDLVLHEGRPGEVYNIGGNNEKTNLEIVKLILKELGKPDTLIKFVKDRLGHDRRYAVDSTKIRNELNWQPEMKFETGIIKTINWHMERISV